jgi:mannose-1-phosphate guanylyltransferase
MESALYAVILAGGRGERFWPLSRQARPKQLLDLVGGKPFLAQAVDRLEPLVPKDRILVLTNADLAAACRRAAPDLPPENVIGEPVGRDTAPAVALSALLIQERDPNAVFCILTADQVMGDLEIFRNVLREAAALAAERDLLVTIGIEPVEPSTSFGYIEAGESLRERGGVEFLNAVRFVEKPDAETAAQYLRSGRFYWNAGMFIWSVRALRAAFRRHAPDLDALIASLEGAADSPDFMERVRDAYERVEKRSIDYAVMEKADNIAVARGRFAWDDVGSWTALERHFEPDDQGNTVLGRLAALESCGNIVYSKERLTALIGIDDLVVVHAEDATLICPKDRAQDIKALVRLLAADPDAKGLT